MKLLYIGQYINHVSSGADQVNRRNQQLLAEIFQGEVVYLEPTSVSFFDKLLLGVNGRMLRSVRRELDKGGFTHLFISQSLMGRVAKFVKLNYPDIVVVSFFHEYLKTTGFRAIPFYLAVKWWEKIGCQYTDKFITLNKRDSGLLKTIYNKEATIELPTSFDNQFNIEQNDKVMLNDEEQIDYLFVGVAFFANIQGIQWFLDNVMPHLKGNLYIVGKGMDKVPFNNLAPNIRIYGFVDDLADFYYRAKLVVSPIFVGGGMKTKTAEALMYGKNIVGTAEAFEGYEIDNRCMYQCSTPDSFITAISSLQNSERLNPHSRDLYNMYYSTNAAFNTLKNIFNE